MILYDDHLCRIIYWRKRKIYYQEINKVEAVLVSSIDRPYYCYFDISSNNKLKAPITISLNAFSKLYRIIMLKAMNELAEQMMHGDFPVTGRCIKAPFSFRNSQHTRDLLLRWYAIQNMLTDHRFAFIALLQIFTKQRKIGRVVIADVVFHIIAGIGD